MQVSTPRLARLHRTVLTSIFMLLCVPLIGAWTICADELTGPTVIDRHVTHIVTDLLEREHLSKHPLDDEISQRGFDAFLKNLDPWKIYFYQSDIDEFKQARTSLDDELKDKDVTFAYEVFERFLTRVDERLTLISELLQQDHDFTIDEELIVDADLARYPRNEKEARDRWRKRIKYDLLVLKGDKTEGQEAIEKLTRRYNSYAKRMHQFDSSELLEIFLTSFTASFDPHTTFMARKAYKNFQISLSLELEGIGAALQSIDGQTNVSKVIPGGAADKHGELKVEDRIVSVGQGTDGEMEDVVDMKLSDVVQRIRGPAGTIVRLGVISKGETETNTYTITRAKIELKDSEARSEIIDEGQKSDGSPMRIGYIDLPSFYMDMEGAKRGLVNFKSTTRDMRRILNEFNSQGVDAVVLDLRRNGGGSLTEAINCTGLFIDLGPVVQVKDQNGRVHAYDDQDRGMAWSGPLVVMTSKFSASASEILAGAIQDYGRGIVVGDEATHGKGTVQSLLDLGYQLLKIPDPPNYGALKITMQQFYRPNGDSTQKRGVIADIDLPSMTNEIENIDEASLDYAIDFDRIPAARYQAMNMVSDELLRNLKEKSESRRRDSEEFQKLVKKIENYREQKERKSVSLNEEKFFARREEIDADKEEEKGLEDQQSEADDDQVVIRNYYVDEVLAITSDYVKLLEEKQITRTSRRP